MTLSPKPRQCSHIKISSDGLFSLLQYVVSGESVKLSGLGVVTA